MELLKTVKKYLNDLTINNSVFEGIEHAIYVTIVTNDDEIIIILLNNINEYSISSNHYSNNEQTHLDYIDIICELTLLFSLFKPQFHYTVLKLDISMLKSLNDISLKFVEWLTSIKPELLLFKSEIYYANKINKKQQSLVIKNYFSVSLDQILQSKNRINIDKSKTTTNLTIFSTKQKELGFSSLIILLEVKSRIITLIDDPELYSEFESTAKLISETFDLSLERENEKPNCYLNYRVHKNFKRINFNHHQSLCILLKVEGAADLTDDSIYKNPKYLNKIGNIITEELTIYKDKFDCELFNDEKSYKARVMLETETQEVANILIGIENELESNHIINFIPDIEDLELDSEEMLISTISKKIVHNILKINN